ncbi:MAG: TatD family hydrolase [Candidatus Methanodesulfokora sp.]
MRLFDAHCHLEDELFDNDRHEVIIRARKAGIIGMVTSPLGIKMALKAIDIFRGNDLVYISPGLDSRNFSDEKAAEELANFIRSVKDGIVAVGEIGLDYKCARSEAEREKQKENFKFLAKLADELNKPVVIHSRWAQRHVLRILDEIYATDVILHAFSGNEDDVRFAAEREWFISISTNVIRSYPVRKAAEISPLDLILLESDSPALSPDGGRNEPANILVSIAEISSMRNLKPEELAEITTENALRAYKISKK